MKKPKHETCIHVEKPGEFAVYVTPGCPMANMVMGHLVSSKKRCQECRHWKARTTK